MLERLHVRRHPAQDGVVLPFGLTGFVGRYGQRALRLRRGAQREHQRVLAAAVQRLRELDLAKPPGVAETIDWARTLDFLGEPDLANARDTLGAVVKDRDDLEVVLDNLREITSGARGA